jgi:hypothetical protein
MKIEISEQDVVKLRVGGAPTPQYDSLEIAAQSYIHKSHGRAKQIVEKVQIDHLQKYGGTQGPYTYCISSPVNDGYAKFIGCWWFLKWIEQQQRTSLSRPVWHQIDGGYYDRLRDQKVNCSGLILTGVVKGSSPIKVEKLRDILERYQNIPRVVLTSDENPLEVFDRLKLGLTSGLMLSTKSKRKVGQ